MKTCYNVLNCFPKVSKSIHTRNWLAQTVSSKLVLQTLHFLL